MLREKFKFNKHPSIFSADVQHLLEADTHENIIESYWVEDRSDEENLRLKIFGYQRKRRWPDTIAKKEC